MYNVLDLGELIKGKGYRQRMKIENRIVKKYKIHLKKMLLNLSKRTKNLNIEESILLKRITEQIKLPKNKRSFFISLSRNIRSQTGQKDKINNGINRYMQYESFLNKLIRKFKIPKELISVAFIESSFNPSAHSKVYASGAWQIMPAISNKLLPKKRRSFDPRLNLPLSSIAALHILKQNYKILSRWDLAILAYNSGPSVYRKLLKKNGPKADISKFLKRNIRYNIGFASKNFISEFLALAHILQYKKNIYKYNQTHHQIDPLFYITKCRFRPETFNKKLLHKYPHIKYFNKQFRYRRSTYNRGNIILSPTKLTTKKYKAIPSSYLTKRYPKNWYKILRKSEKCNV